MIFTTELGRRIVTAALLGKGGEGEVWAIQGDASQVAKIYHPKNRQPEREAKIKAMVANPPKDETLTFDPPHVSIAWPTAPLYDQGKFAGYLMPRIENSPNIFQVYNTTARAKTALAHFDWRYMHRVAQNFAIALHALHDKGDVMGDVNQKNVLVTDTAMVTLVDTDSFQIQDGPRTFRCTVGVPDYTPPELHGLKLDTIDRSVEHDRFGLAVLIFQLLMQGFHPFTGAPKDPQFSVEGSLYVYCIKNGLFPYQNNPTIKPPAQSPHIDCLHPDLQVLFGRTFIAGHRQPHLRPTTKDWMDGLKVAERDLVQCQKNPKHWYGDHLARCPWCDPPGTVPTPRTSAAGLTQQPMPGLAQSKSVTTPKPAPTPALRLLGWVLRGFVCGFCGQLFYGLLLGAMGWDPDSSIADVWVNLFVGWSFWWGVRVVWVWYVVCKWDGLAFLGGAVVVFFSYWALWMVGVSLGGFWQS